jgi:uncharacterized membrane protein YphA (DoxX/SURF4 family)
LAVGQERAGIKSDYKHVQHSAACGAGACANFISTNKNNIMKTAKIIYWVVTAIVAVMMLFSAYSYFSNPGIKTAFEHLGFPDYFRVELAIAKILGALLLLAPVAARFKEWAYAGFAIVFISAFIAHRSAGDAAGMWAAPLVFLVLLAVSYTSWNKLQGRPLLAWA